MRADDEIARMVYDYLKNRYTTKELQSETKYDEILNDIKIAFGDEIMMMYIDSGFTRPPRH